MAEFLGSSGSLIGSALETAGYYYQSWLLDALAGPFVGAGGTLIYLIGAMIAVVSVAITGRFKLAPWLLIGPTLFYAVTFARTETDGSEWQFGGEKRNMAQRDKELQDILEHEGVDIDLEKPRVSSLFAKYNKIISNTVAETVRVINAGRKNTDRRFVLRSELVTYMRSVELEDPGLRDLIHSAFKEECREVLEVGDEITDPFASNAEKLKARDKFYRIYAEQKRVKLNAPSKDFLASLRHRYGEAQWQKLLDAMVVTASPKDDQEVKGKDPQPDKNEAEEEAATTALHDWLLAAQKRDTELDGKPVADADVERVEIDKARRDLSDKAFSCHEVWSFILVGINQRAIQKYNEAKTRAVMNDIPEEDFLNSILQASGFSRKYFDKNVVEREEKIQLVYRTIATYLFRNEYQSNNLASFMYKFSSRAREVAHVRVPHESDLAFTERSRGQNREWQEKSRIMSHAMQLPYYQGLGLYLLAVTFPFFALLLLIPGKHGGFMLWFLLWLWVKSWDIGFAVVMSLDDILFGLMAEGQAPFGGAKPDVELSPEVLSAMKMIEYLDPTYNLGTYYSIIAVALHSIPMISAQLIMGSLKGGSGLISEGMTKFSEKFASAQMQNFAHTRMMSNRAEAMGLKMAMSSDYTFNSLTGRGITSNANRRGNGQQSLPPVMSDDARASAKAAQSGVAPEHRGTADEFRSGTRKSGLSRAQAHRAAGLSAAAARGLNDPENLRKNLGVGASGGKKSLDAYAGVAGATMPMTKYYENRHKTMRAKELDTAATWANYDAINSARGQRLVAETVIEGDMLNVPWTEPLATTKELELELQRFKNRVDFYKAGAETMETGVRAGQDAIQAHKGAKTTSAVPAHKPMWGDDPRFLDPKRRKPMWGAPDVSAIASNNSPKQGFGNDQTVARNFGEKKTPEFGEVMPANYGLGIRGDGIGAVAKTSQQPKAKGKEPADPRMRNRVPQSPIAAASEMLASNKVQDNERAGPRMRNRVPQSPIAAASEMLASNKVQDNERAGPRMRNRVPQNPIAAANDMLASNDVDEKKEQKRSPLRRGKLSPIAGFDDESIA